MVFTVPPRALPSSLQVLALALLLAGCVEPSADPAPAPVVQYWDRSGPEASVLPCGMDQTFADGRFAVDDSTGRVWVVFTLWDTTEFLPCTMAAPGVDALSNLLLVESLVGVESSSLYLTWSDDGGSSFATAQRLKTHSGGPSGGSNASSLWAGGGRAVVAFRASDVLSDGFVLVQTEDGSQFSELRSPTFNAPTFDYTRPYLLEPEPGQLDLLLANAGSEGPLLRESLDWEPVGPARYPEELLRTRGSHRPGRVAVLESEDFLVATADGLERLTLTGDERDLRLTLFGGPEPTPIWLDVPPALRDFAPCGWDWDVEGWYTVIDLAADEEGFLAHLGCPRAPELCVSVTGGFDASGVVDLAWWSWEPAIPATCSRRNPLESTGSVTWQASPIADGDTATGVRVFTGWPANSTADLEVRELPLPRNWAMAFPNDPPTVPVAQIEVDAEGTLRLMGAQVRYHELRSFLPTPQSQPRTNP